MLELTYTRACARIIVLFVALLLSGRATMAQTTAFTYQGKLTDAGNPANGNYDLQFKLFDALSSGAQQGATITNPMVTASNGIFTVTLDFGAAAFPGANRWLEIGVRPAGSVNPYTVLAPRQAITSTPYAIQALNAAQLGGVMANQYVTVTSGGASYIQNQNSGMPQPSSNFYISGNGTADGTFSGNIVNAVTQYNLGGSRMLAGDATVGSGNTFTGAFAGTNNTAAGVHNSFYGLGAGFNNQSGGDNSFFGYFAGDVNTGFSNSFFGSFAGQSNSTGSENAFFGRQAGSSNSMGSNNAFFGRSAGNLNTTGTGNSYFGRGAGQSNTVGNGNAFFGDLAGSANTVSGNSFFGSQAGMNNSTGTSNTFIGSNAGTSLMTGSNNTAIGAGASIANGVSNATAIGAGATATTSNNIVLGTSSNDVIASGSLVVTHSLVVGQLLSVSSTPLCYVPSAGANLLATCSSSLRYKTNVQTFKVGLEIIHRLRPISFTWKQSGSPDIGLGAEEVEKVEPLLTFHNEKGEIEGVRYTQLSAVFINAIKEQQLQIEQQQQQINDLKKQLQQMKQFVCSKRSHSRRCQ